jgi:hypothetical protein
VTRLPVIEDVRPRTFDQCLAAGWGEHVHGNRCPFVGCKSHAAWVAIGVVGREPTLADLDRLEALDLDALPVTCLRRDGLALGHVGQLFGVTRERARQIETKALRKLRHPSREQHLRGYRSDGDGVSRPDLHAGPGRIDSAEIARAAERLVPEIARSAGAARRRQLGQAVRCATRSCAGIVAGRRPKDARLARLCVACRRADPRGGSR